MRDTNIARWEREEWFTKDPIEHFAEVLKQQGVCEDAELDAIKAVVIRQFNEAVEVAKREPHPTIQDLTTDVYS